VRLDAAGHDDLAGRVDHARGLAERPGAATAAIVPSCTAISTPRACGVTTWPFRITRSA